MADKYVRVYFTYGSSKSHPYEGGWTLVKAPDRNAALCAFRAIHPSPGLLLCCAAVYDEEEFKKTEMYKKGNRGAFCHEVITIKQEVYEA